MPVEPTPASGNPPIDYVVAVWLGMPDAELERGLREGWIRGPQGGAAAPEASRENPPAGHAQEVGGTSPLQGTSHEAVGRDRVFALVRRLDASLDESTFAALWNDAGPDDAVRASRFADFLAPLLGVAPTGGHEGIAFATLEQAAVGASGTARLVRLAAYSGSELASLAGGDAALRRALATHADWALTDDRALAARFDPEGRYDRFDRDTGEALLSDAWLGDRARHAAWRLATAAGRPLDVSGDGWRFVDRADASAAVELKGSSGSAVHQVTFAHDGGDRFNGGEGTDRVHGGDGDDLLRGRGGDDLLEGARGDDVLAGGSGGDDLAGQRGDDELDGGTGNDRLEGGSGDDDLTGGRGDDLLRGGAGRDVYRFDAGDGADSIDDDDGGEIVIDDVVLAGRMQRDGDGWSSADGRLQFSLEGPVAQGGILTIRSASGSPGGDTIRIDRWRQDAFGFSLASQVDEAQADDAGRPQSLLEPDATYLQANDEWPATRIVSDAFGNEGSPGVPAPADDRPTHDVVAPGSGADRSSLVDLVAASRALQRFEVPMPPDVDAADLAGVDAISPAMVADAVASDLSATDDGEGTVGLAMPDWPSLPAAPGWTDPLLAPPQPRALLRSSA